MTLDTSDLRRTIHVLEEQRDVLEEQIAHLRRVADAADAEAFLEADLTTLGLTLPDDVIVTKPGEIAVYLHQHPDLIPIASEMAAALVAEFRGEHSEIELLIYHDPEIVMQELTFYVRVPAYDDGFMARLDKAIEPYLDRFTHASDMILVTTDYRPIA